MKTQGCLLVRAGNVLMRIDCLDRKQQQLYNLTCYGVLRMKRQMLIGLVAGSLFAFAGLAFAQGAAAPAAAPAAAAPAKKEAAPMKKEEHKKNEEHKKSSHHKSTHHTSKKKTEAPAAHTK
jgi:hypothetical protein